MKTETWRGLIYDGHDLSHLYMISDQGKLANARSGKTLKWQVSKRGYSVCIISLGSREEYMTIRAHRAVACTFIPNPEGKPFVNHIDGDKTNNCIENLEWVTTEENQQHAESHGLVTHLRGSLASGSKLTREQVLWARANYTPYHPEFGLMPMSRKLKVDKHTLKKAIDGETYLDMQ